MASGGVAGQACFRWTVDGGAEEASRGWGDTEGMFLCEFVSASEREMPAQLGRWADEGLWTTSSLPRPSLVLSSVCPVMLFSSKGPTTKAGGVKAWGEKV